MLACDGTNSVLFETNSGSINEFTYAPYGHRSEELPGSTHLGCNGQLKEEQTGCYLLGNGYRAFSPLLMRFHSPDSWSPFGDGGLNPYSYTMGDPVNHIDPTGHVRWGALLAVLMNSGDDVGRMTTGRGGFSSRNVPFPASQVDPAAMAAARNAGLPDGWSMTPGPSSGGGRAGMPPASNVGMQGSTMQNRGAPLVQAGGPSNSMPGPSRGGSQQRRVHFGPDVPTSQSVNKASNVPKASDAPIKEKTIRTYTTKEWKNLSLIKQLEHTRIGGVDPTQKGFHGSTQKNMFNVRKTSSKFSEDNN